MLIPKHPNIMATSTQTPTNSRSPKNTVLSFQQFRELYGKKVAVYQPVFLQNGNKYQQVGFFSQEEARETRVFVSKTLDFITASDIVRLKDRLCVIINPSKGIAILSVYKSDASQNSHNTMEIVEGLD